jgi:hypothetical protein
LITPVKQTTDDSNLLKTRPIHAINFVSISLANKILLNAFIYRTGIRRVFGCFYTKANVAKQINVNGFGMTMRNNTRKRIRQRIGKTLIFG